MKLKKGDRVVVTAGKDKGRKGKIEKILPKLNKVLIPTINVYKRHAKPQGEKQPGGIVEVTKPLFASKVALICPKCSKPTRVGYQIDKKGSGRQKVARRRICRKCQSII